jgi:hypothetical protein
VAIRDVHRGPNGHLGEQGCDGANVGGTPDILQREVDGAKAILGNNGKTIAVKGGSATCTRDSSSQRGRQNTGDVVCNAARPACAADCAKEARNKTNMDAMMEKMNALVAVGGAQQAHQADKENTPLGRNVIPLGGGNQVKKPRRKKALCPNCKCFVMHKPASCYKLKANKASRYPGWKLIFAVPATT